VVSGTAYTFGGLQSGVAYRFRGQSYNQYGGSGWSDWAGPVYQDTLPPVTDADVVGVFGQNGWWRSAVSVALLSNDQGCLGAAQIGYTLDGAAYAYGGPFTVGGDGVHTLSYAATDGVNAEAAHTLSIPIDTTPPQTSVTVNGGAPQDRNGTRVGRSR
jgi:hypothetical protein